MLDKIYFKNSKEIVLIFTNRSPVTISSSEGNAYQLYLWMSVKTHLTFEEFMVALKEEKTDAGVDAE